MGNMSFMAKLLDGVEIKWKALRDGSDSTAGLKRNLEKDNKIVTTILKLNHLETVNHSV